MRYLICCQSGDCDGGTQCGRTTAQGVNSSRSLFVPKPVFFKENRCFLDENVLFMANYDTFVSGKCRELLKIVQKAHKITRKAPQIVEKLPKNICVNSSRSFCCSKANVFQGNCLFFRRKRAFYSKLRHFCKCGLRITRKDRDQKPPSFGSFST